MIIPVADGVFVELMSCIVIWVLKDNLSIDILFGVSILGEENGVKA